MLPHLAERTASPDARLAALQLHERLVPGCEAALRSFLKAGCGGQYFSKVMRSGEYDLYCQVPKAAVACKGRWCSG
jgi:hypothetical protein